MFHSCCATHTQQGDSQLSRLSVHEDDESRPPREPADDARRRDFCARGGLEPSHSSAQTTDRHSPHDSHEPGLERGSFFVILCRVACGTVGVRACAVC